MLSLVAVLVLGVLAQQTFADEPEAIVGGQRAVPGEFPYQISLRYDGSHICGGTIISSSCIVTAAHCLHGMQNVVGRMRVAVGDLGIRGGTQYAIKSARIHPQYDANRINNDIAVICLAQPLQLNNYVQPLPLCTQRPLPGTKCTVSGWGKTGTYLPPASYLLKADVPVVENSYCKNSHGSWATITNAQICTFLRQGVGACQGDSGGPLKCGGCLAGVVSWGNPCANGYPDVFASVPNFLDFVQQSRLQC